MYDIVGDIHGHASRLTQLLKSLGYKQSNGVWSHPSRTLISIGDLIDRGPQQKAVIDILKPMTDEGHAIVLMGNHEFNAVSWALKDQNGDYLRPHTEKNYMQHKAFLEQANVNSNWYEETINWFKSLPLLFETSDFCCVHAAWDTLNINYLKQNLSEQLTLLPHQWELANNTSHELFNAIEYCLKGPEVSLPQGYSFHDGGGHERTKIRLKWWSINTKSTYSNSAISVPNPSSLPNVPLPSKILNVNKTAKPIFFGHYWMTGQPMLLTNTIACLDWSVVKSDGVLAAYRYDGEEQLEQNKLIWV